MSPGLTESEIDKTMLNEAAREFWSKGKEVVGAIAAKDVANAILFAYQMPQNVILQELTITPTRQEY